MTSTAAADDRPGAPLYSTAQQRIIAAALALFAEHGVSGTSLQTIADAVGVTKAAVYHQFPAKEEIVVAAVDVELAQVFAALDRAEQGEPGRSAAEIVLAQVIDNAVARRRMVSTLQHDPVINRMLAHQEHFQEFMRRLYRVLVGDARSPEARVRAAMIASAIGGAVMHPFVADLDDDTLRTELLRITRQFLEAAGD